MRDGSSEKQLSAIAAAATAVVLAAVAIPVTLRMEAAPITPAKPRVTNPKPWEINLSIDPSYPGHMVAESTSGLTVQLPGGEETYGIDVRAEKPSRYTEKWLNTGEPVTVQGHPGRFSAEWKPAPKTAPGISYPTTVAWTDPTGMVIVVRANYWGVDRTAVLAVAEAVRLGAPHTITMPFRLGPLPFELQVDSVRTYPHPERPNRTDVAEVTLTSPTLKRGGSPPRTFPPLAIAARIHTTERQITRYGRAHPVPDVAGHRAWYQTETSGPPELIGMATLTVEAGACMYEFTTDVKVLSLDQLRDIAAGTTYADCTDKSTWTAPVS